MPRGDGTGPMGMGPLTGRGMRYCIGAGYPGNVRGGGRFFGRGFGMGRGMGRGFFGGGFPAPASAEPEKSVLENQVLAMEQNLAELKKRLSEMA